MHLHQVVYGHQDNMKRTVTRRKAHVFVASTRDTLVMWAEEKDIQSASRRRQSIDRHTASCAELALPLPRSTSVGTAAGMAYWGTKGALEGCRTLFCGKNTSDVKSLQGRSKNADGHCGWVVRHAKTSF